MSDKQTGGAAVESAAQTEFGRLSMPRGFKRPGEEQADSPKMARTTGEDTGGERTQGGDSTDALESRTAVVLHRPEGSLQRDPQPVAPAVVRAELGLRDQQSASMNRPNLRSAPHPVDDSGGKNAFRRALEQAPLAAISAIAPGNHLFAKMVLPSVVDSNPRDLQEEVSKLQQSVRERDDTIGALKTAGAVRDKEIAVLSTLLATRESHHQRIVKELSQANEKLEARIREIRPIVGQLEVLVHGHGDHGTGFDHAMNNPPQN
jgi:hypothetical protein